jgi:hypothetical protein
MQPSQTACRYCGLPLHVGKPCREAKAEARTATMEAAACAGKVPHATQFAAAAAVRRMQSSRNRDRRSIGHLKVYQCAHCGCWHVG